MANKGFIKKQKTNSASLSEVYPITFSDNSSSFWGSIKNGFLLRRHFGEIRLWGRCLFPSAHERHRRKQKDRATFLMLQGTLTNKQLIWLGRRLRKSPSVRTAKVCWRVRFSPEEGYRYLVLLDRFWPSAVDLHFFLDDRIYWWQEQNLPMPRDKDFHTLIPQWEAHFQNFYAAATWIRLRHALWMQIKETEVCLRSAQDNETFAENRSLLNELRLLPADRKLTASEKGRFRRYLYTLERIWLKQELPFRQLETWLMDGTLVTFIHSVLCTRKPMDFQNSVYLCYDLLDLHLYPMEKRLALAMLGISLDEWYENERYPEARKALVTRAYKERARVLHPDKKSGHKTQFQVLTQARDHLQVDDDLFGTPAYVESKIAEYREKEDALLSGLLTATEASYNEQGGDDVELPTPHLAFGKNLCNEISQQVSRMQKQAVWQKKKARLAAWLRWLQCRYPAGKERQVLLQAYAQERKTLLKEEKEALSRHPHLGRLYVFKKEWKMSGPLLKAMIPPLKSIASLEHRLATAKARLGAYGKQAVHWYHPVFLGGRSIDTYVRRKGYDAVISAAEEAAPTFPRLDRWLGRATKRNALAAYARLSAPLFTEGTREQTKSQTFMAFMEAFAPPDAPLRPSHVRALPPSHALFKIARSLDTLFPTPDPKLDPLFKEKAKCIIAAAQEARPVSDLDEIKIAHEEDLEGNATVFAPLFSSTREAIPAEPPASSHSPSPRDLILPISLKSV